MREKDKYIEAEQDRIEQEQEQERLLLLQSDVHLRVKDDGWQQMEEEA